MSRYGDLAVHRWMLRDEVRNEAYRRALAHVVKPGDVVLDMGAGTGILSIFAAMAGARKVYAVERTQVAAVARHMIERNGCADRIEVIEQDLEDVVLPEKVDVIVSEWMGGFGVDENMLAPLVMARDRWLKPGGKIIPERVTSFVAAAEVADFAEEIAYWRSKPHGLDMSIIASMTTQESFHTQLHLTPEDLIAAPQAMWSHDAHTCSLEEADQPFIARCTFAASRAGEISGLLAWFTADMGDGNVLTNAIGSPRTHWGRTLFPFDKPIRVAADAPIEVEVRCLPSIPGSCEFYWSVKTGDHPLEEHDIVRHRQKH